MRMLRNLLLILLFSTYFVATLGERTGQNGDDGRKTYIVYMGELPGPEISAMSGHHNLLAEAIGDVKVARESIIHSYRRSFNGFVARLLPHEAQALSDDDSVVSVFPNTVRKLHTTRSWDFLGLPLKSKKRNSQIESNIIVGVLDTGIYMQAPSFRDKGYGPPPAKWKGKCMKGANFTGCNNKVIGAKYFKLETGRPYWGTHSPVDDDGHGTHTSSIVAGAAVKGASVYGVAKGTARGGVSLSRIAVYKVCWITTGCLDVDILAGFDEAIADGVDLISVSLGGHSRSFLDNPIAIGSFHAMKKGIFVSCAAGNDGLPASVENVAPWVMTVAANTIDRQLQTVVKLGNGQRISGNSLNTYSPKKLMYPLISGTLAANMTMRFGGDASACDAWALDANKVVGRIVYCQGFGTQDSTMQKLKGAGTLMTRYELDDYAYSPIIPGTEILVQDGIKIEKYINSTKNPMAVIYKTRTPSTTAPIVASFSSRGPQHMHPNILKASLFHLSSLSLSLSLSTYLVIIRYHFHVQPDISAPGVNILAAYPKIRSITGYSDDRRHNVFNMLSGTSMSCPHVTAAAAYVKSFHPDWSPAAIKSALMTTATPMKNETADTQLATGAGQVNPKKAVHPGLVYDITPDDYISFLCKEGFNDTDIGTLIGDKKKYKCSDFKHPRGTDGLNYPSMHLQLFPNDNYGVPAVFYRRVTHVGFGNSVYKAKVTNLNGLRVKVIPSTLTFTKLHQKRSFKVVVTGRPAMNETVMHALLQWDDSKHNVKSHIVVYKHLN
ncbi:hypothetical protein C1H46_031097 [Malus baccata]|uniref:Subtilisin-like protease fibronectin type-III domain-containing protein n=1 Tax=Malus baccata TaxID=106549 RepID=A0A540LA24_MALBA|nr:hypothetical protein C1H46_031097 [Malus baccata]